MLKKFNIRLDQAEERINEIKTDQFGRSQDGGEVGV